MEKIQEEAEGALAEKRFNISCCRSYLTPKGRCYTCPELEEGSGIEKDPDEETW